MNISKITVDYFFKNKPFAEQCLCIETPKFIKIGKKTFDVYEDLKKELTFGQKIALFQDIGEENQAIIKKILSFIYYPSYFDCIFDFSKATQFQDVIGKCKIIEAYPATMFYVGQMVKIKEYEEEKLKNEPSPESRQAGIDQFNKFGVFATIDMLAQGKILDHDKIKDLPYLRVLNKLYLENTKQKYEERLREVLKNKK